MSVRTLFAASSSPRLAAFAGAVLLVALLPSAPAQAKAPAPKKADFTFNTLTPGKAVPFTQTENGLTASFSAPGGAEVLRAVTRIPGFSGDYLFLPNGDLTLTFDKPVTEVSLNFAAAGLVNSPTTVFLDGYAPSGGGFESVGSVQSIGRRYAVLGPLTLSFGVLDLTSRTPFTQITVDSTDDRPFAVDNIEATPAAVPEASTTLSLGLLLILGGLAGVGRRKKSDV